MKFKLLLEYYGDDLAKTIREELKKAGYKVPAQITVKQRKGGLETALDVIIKDLRVDYEKVNAIAKKYQSVDRDERSGEILGGGNTFIFVKYDRHAEETTEELYKPKVIALIKQGLANIGKMISAGKGLEIAFAQDNTAYKPIDINKVEPWTRTAYGYAIDRSYVAQYKGKMLNDNGYKLKKPLWRLLFDYNIEP